MKHPWRRTGTQKNDYNPPLPPAKAGQALQGGEFDNTLKNNII